MNNFPICVVVYLTNHCYLKCPHCFLNQLNQLNKDSIDYEKIKKTLKELRDNNVFMIAYTGGDPLLHKNVYDILKYTYDLGMMPLLGISGCNITEDIADKIYESGVRCVQIGLNGSTSNINDKYRGSNSFKPVLNAIKLLQEKKINVNISFCIDKDNYNDVDEMLQFAITNKIYKVKIEFWESLNHNKDKVLTLQEREKIYNKCESFMKENNLNDWIQCPKTQSSLNTIRKKAIVIMANGDVKNTELSETIGNINEESIIDIVNKRRNNI